MGKSNAKQVNFASSSGSVMLTLDTQTAKNLLLALTNALGGGAGKGKPKAEVKAIGPKAPGPKALGVKAPGPKAPGPKH